MKHASLNAPLFILVTLTLISRSPSLGEEGKQTFSPEQWSFRCWNGETRRWENLGPGKMTITGEGSATRITNSSGIHRHAHLVYPAVPEGDFTFTIKLRGGYELGFLNAEGKDEMLYLELANGDKADGALEQKEFRTYELSRKGTRLSIRRDGGLVPLVHFNFDCGEAFVITLAIREKESAEIQAVSLKHLP